MTLRIRRTIYISLIIFFVVVTPIIVLYFSGFRYDFKKNKFARIGAIELQSDKIEDKASVYLDNELIKKGFDDKLWIDGLFPDTYNIKIEKENYFTCEKTVEVQSSLTTFVKDVILFKQSEPTLISQNPVSHFYSPDNKNILIVQKNNQGYQIEHINTDENETITLIPLLTHQPIAIFWSNNNGQIMLEFEKTPDFYIYNLTDGQGFFLSDIADVFFDQIIWSDNEGKLLGVIGNKLFEINLNQLSYEKILNFPRDIDIPLYYLNNNIYWAASDNKFSYLFSADLNNLKCDSLVFSTCDLIPRTITSVKKTTDFEFIKNGNDIIFHDKPNNILYIIDQNNALEPIRYEIKDILGLEWKNNKLLYWNEFEIWIYQNENQELVERLSTSITQATWYPDQEYILYVSDNKLTIKEIKQDETCNNYELLEADGLNDVLVNDKGEQLYFFSNLNGEQGIYNYQLL